MPRYVVERIFPDGLNLPDGAARNELLETIIRNNGELGVTWLQSHVSADRSKSFCIYDAPDPEAIYEAGRRSGIPVTTVTRVSVLTPYAY